MVSALCLDHLAQPLIPGARYSAMSQPRACSQPNQGSPAPNSGGTEAKSRFRPSACGAPNPALGLLLGCHRGLLTFGALWPRTFSCARWVWCASGAACKGPSQPHSCDAMTPKHETYRGHWPPCPAGLSELHGGAGLVGRECARPQGHGLGESYLVSCLQCGDPRIIVKGPGWSREVHSIFQSLLGREVL